MKGKSDVRASPFPPHPVNHDFKELLLIFLPPPILKRIVVQTRKWLFVYVCEGGGRAQ